MPVMRSHTFLIRAAAGFLVIFASGRCLCGVEYPQSGSFAYWNGCVEDAVVSREAASAFARIALSCLQREYPNKPEHVINEESEVDNPRAFHPAFYGCFDWHSAVHGHWMLARLLRVFPDLPEADAIRAVLSSDLSAGNIEAEAAYMVQEGRKSFERTYGWAWFLKLAEELGRSGDEDIRLLSLNLEPLTRVVIDLYLDFLPKQSYPIRRGVHPNTAFGLSFALDYARFAGETELERLVIERSLEYFGHDCGCPWQWEPDGDDFFSRCLIEADLMRRVLPRRQFGEWLGGFMPELVQARKVTLLPAEVSDRSDPKIVHLDGLNLSRAWCMIGIAAALSGDDPRRGPLEESACLHARATLPYIASGNYEGEHWLASFAVYMLSSSPDSMQTP